MKIFGISGIPDRDYKIGLETKDGVRLVYIFQGKHGQENPKTILYAPEIIRTAKVVENEENWKEE